MFCSKAFAYYITASSAIFSDTIESIVHIVATVLVLFSIIYAAKPPDEKHFYGRGNIEYFSAGFEGLLIIIAAFTILYAGISGLFTEPEIKEINSGAIILLVAGVVHLFVGSYIIKIGKQTKSLALIADGNHVLTDSFTSLGVFAGLILVSFTDWYIIDSIVAIIIGIQILYTGYILIQKSFSELMNETDPVLLEQISQLLIKNRKVFWIDLFNLKFWTSGENIYIDFHLTFPYYYTIKESNDEENRIKSLLEEELHNAEVSIHLHYCNKSLCKICEYQKCHVRMMYKTVQFDWNTDKLLGKPVVMDNHKTKK